MKIIELSYDICENSPKWPTNPDEKIIIEQSTDLGDDCNASTVYHHLHNGTHVDAPRHFCPEGKCINQIPVEDFYYERPYVWKIKKGKGECITEQEVREREDELKFADIIFIYTGYSSLRAGASKEYANEFPYISGEAALYLRQNFPQLKAIALDVLSVDSGVTGSRQGFPAHHALLDTMENGNRTLLIYEDVNIEKILNEKEIFQICAFPIRFCGLEAAPVSIVAFAK